ncbi:hypothetical protein [Promicromonospora soli]|uniref:Uncharacterized protein n=1 Tax=Promicromonospora soli TaxID=2035533 RepID=A0A919G4Q5_9MICO|nr:hypothetical protein [Promicromonospora soli]GHH78032.1 hypothetical protein GCM10017772_40570 [Promicromonospora soli]
MLIRSTTRLVLLSGAVALVGVLATAAPAVAAPSCVAQSIASEHDSAGTAWGHDVVAFLATSPEVLEEYGFHRFGDLASYGAQQDHGDCPAGL